MNVARLASIAATMSCAAWVLLADAAEASEWGCEVLLCASSSDPSWRGVPACHPPMYRLISAMDRPGFSWPTCPEASTSGPGYERYDECPEGWSVAYSNQDRGGGEPDLCVLVRNTCPAGFRGRQDCQQTASMPRPVREKPYYFDIRHHDDNATRHWFSLRR
jgi:hypothetical protein